MLSSYLSSSLVFYSMEFTFIIMFDSILRWINTPNFWTNFFFGKYLTPDQNQGLHHNIQLNLIAKEPIRLRQSVVKKMESTPYLWRLRQL